MAYSTDFSTSARRHLRAACELYEAATAGAQPGCRAVAGYLFGLSGELAVKEIMRDSGMTPMAESQRRDDPFYAHFESLKTSLRDMIHGRRSGELRVISEDASLFQHWNTDMRYAPTAEILDARIDAWRRSAHDLVARMDAI